MTQVARASSSKPQASIHWFRRDLRLDDNHGLFRALTQYGNVLPLFIFDTNILDRLDDKCDRRVDLIHRRLLELQREVEKHGSSMLVEHGEPVDVWGRILERFDVTGVTAAHDHEPYTNERDKAVGDLLRSRGIPFRTYKDINIFERNEVTKDDGSPYTVYTPYARKWKLMFKPEMAQPFATKSNLDRLYRTPAFRIPSLGDIGFLSTDLSAWVSNVADPTLRNYEQTRNFPALEGTSRMSVPLRFGMVSVRQLVSRGSELSQAYLNELIWREFFMQILWHFPKAERAFKPAYDRIEWLADEEGFRLWCEGRTGYPLVDAGMRELLATGLMHNRVRMVVASFLCKHLLIDRRWGEAWFAAKLLDFELSSNNGGWQWASGSGCDAAPYFRVFNPTLQMERFDPQLKYVKRWVPEYGTANYVQPMVVHEMARKRAIATYKAGLSGTQIHNDAQNELFA